MSNAITNLYVVTHLLPPEAASRQLISSARIISTRIHRHPNPLVLHCSTHSNRQPPPPMAYQDALNCLSSLISSKVRGVGANRGDRFDIMPHYLQILELEEPISKLKVIHVAGTKGKGSTCSFAESILRNCGFRTGLFTSPHLIDVRERFMLEGIEISEDKFLEYFWWCWKKLEEKTNVDVPMPPYFRFLALLAFKIFTAEKVDVAIMEVGLGGRYDATNVVRTPVVCGISSLGYDHMEILGNTLAEIAGEKAGIFKETVPAFTVPQPQEAMHVLEERSSQLSVPLLIAPPLDIIKLNGQKLGLDGDHQYLNAGLAVSLCRTWLEKMGHLESTHLDGNVTMSDQETKSVPQFTKGGPLFDPTSHYYLKSTDYGPLTMTNILQDSSNYYLWNRELTTILITRRKLGFVLGSLKPPPESDFQEYEAWLTFHGVIRQWIWSSVSKEIASQIMYTDDPAVIWADLRDQFKQSNETHIYQLNNDASGTFQGPDTVSTFYTKLKTLWREIDAYGETPHCDCGKCQCDVNGRISGFVEKTRIRKFLMGLNDDFRQLRSSILASEPLPKLSKIYQLVSHEESQHGLSSNQAGAHAFFTKGTTSKLHSSEPPTIKSTSQIVQTSTSQNPTPQNSRKRPPPPSGPIYYKSGRQINTKYYCFHCSAFGHSDEKCYALHGLPLGHKYSKVSSSNPKPQASANCVTGTSAWSAWEDDKPKEKGPLIRYKRTRTRASTSKPDSTPVSPKTETKTEKKEEVNIGTDEFQFEEDPNPIGPYGFPLYSDKYNPKPLPNYSPGTINYINS